MSMKLFCDWCDKEIDQHLRKLNESVRRLLCDQIYEWLDGDTVEERKE